MPANSPSSGNPNWIEAELPNPCTFEDQITRLITQGLRIHANPTTTFSVCTDWPVPPTGEDDETLIRIDTDRRDESANSIMQALVLAPMNGRPLRFFPASYGGIFPGTRVRFYLHCVNKDKGAYIDIVCQTSALITHVSTPCNLFHLANSTC